MRTALVWVGMAAVCLCGSTARAQAPAFPAPQAGTSKNAPMHAGPDGRVRRQVSQSDQLIFERASAKAIERTARIESQKWAGYHPQRPAVRHGQHNNDLNRYLYSPVVGYYYFPSYGPY